MSTIAEIEAAIERLPARQQEEIACWLDELRLRRSKPPVVDTWLEQARGAATVHTTTESVMALTRGDE
jgi:hypothetical protein